MFFNLSEWHKVSRPGRIFIVERKGKCSLAHWSTNRRKAHQNKPILALATNLETNQQRTYRPHSTINEPATILTDHNFQTTDLNQPSNEPTANLTNSFSFSKQQTSINHQQSNANQTDLIFQHNRPNHLSAFTTTNKPSDTSINPAARRDEYKNWIRQSITSVVGFFFQISGFLGVNIRACNLLVISR